MKEQLFQALDSFQIETPSWGYADTGTRFGKYLQPAAAVDIADKIADAGHVHSLTGCCATVAVHVQWDFPADLNPQSAILAAQRAGVRIGSINPNLFQNQDYKYGSFGNEREEVRQAALRHVLDSIELGKKTGSREVSLWFADGSNYPGQSNIRSRKSWFEQCLVQAHAALGEHQALLVEYKPFEPQFYHTDVADWGMAFLLAKKAGPQAKVLVDTGHHYPSQNIEQIVVWLLSENMLGGFHFNDRRYADDDLTLGSIDPYQLFRIFHEIRAHAFESGEEPKIAYMIDQSHNDKPKIEAMIQSVTMAQELFAKASLVDHNKLAEYQQKQQQVDAEELLRRAFFTDVTPSLREWRRIRGLPEEPILEHRQSGYEVKVACEREEKRKALGVSSGGSYA